MNERTAAPPPPARLIAAADGETFGRIAIDPAGALDGLPDFFAKGTTGDEEFSRWTHALAVMLYVMQQHDKNK